jgi:ribosomal protein S18 acetylase RimI-like enzyme
MQFAHYTNEAHSKQFYEMNLEYVTWVAGLYEKVHNIDLESINEKSNEEYVREFLEEFTKVKPPQGIIYVIEEDQNVIGMGAITTLEEGIGEIKRMYIRPQYRGKGLGKEMLGKLVERGKTFGFTKIRLETADFFEVARHLYQSIGFEDIEEYLGGEVSLSLRNTTRYMEMNLNNT